MRVVCPHCQASYRIDDARVPPGGLNVRCVKCGHVFPVSRELAVGDPPVPLPAPRAAVRAPATGPPRPPPVPPRPARAEAAAPSPRRAAPAPALPPVALPPPLPFAAPTALGGELAPGASGERAAGDANAELPDPFGYVEEVAAPHEPLGFGEVELAADPAAAGGVEVLVGDRAAEPQPARVHGGSTVHGGYKLRRRSGKIFGPFDDAQIVEMLEKRELMGNEDVSPDGASWAPIGDVAAFREAIRTLAAEAPAPQMREARDPKARVAPGERTAAAAAAEGATARESRAPRGIIFAAAGLLVLAAIGVGAGFTRYGFFFVKAFRRGDAAQVARLLAEVRAPLDRAEYAADRLALAAAARAVAAAPETPEAAAMHAMIVAALELRHGAPPGALDQARRAADRLQADESGTVPALAARLAVALATSPGAGTLPHETALERASANAPPDAETIALLGRAALARGDAARAAALFAKLEGMRPGTARPAYGQALALLSKRDLAGAKASFEKVLAAHPGHLPSRLELAILAEATGDVAGAEAQLAPLVAEEAAAKLAPAERARALVLRGALLARASKLTEAEEAYGAAVEADPRLVDARLALARHRLRHGDAAGAVAALDPVAGQAAALTELAALRVQALSAAGRALDASSLADQALARAPGDPALLLAKASVLAALGKRDEAIALYRDAAAREPAAFEPHLALGRIALERGDLAQARLSLTTAVEKGPREPGTRAALAQLILAEGDTAQAESAFQAALALDPQYAPAEIGLARIALARGDVTGARARLERALARDPRSVDGHVARGELLWSAKDLAAAEKEFQLALDVEPRNVDALWRLGAVKLERGEDVDGAVQRLTAASNEEPRRAGVRQWLGRALLKKGETPGAIAQLRKAVELEPHNPQHRLHLGAALERSGALAEAVDEYRAATAADPKCADGYEKLGLLYFANARFEDAAAAYDKAVALAPRTSRLRIALADCKGRLGKHDEAVRMYRAVMKADPSAVQVVYKLARALHQSEGARAALPWYERAAREDRNNPMPHYYLGYLYKERGQKAKASAEFRRFLQLKPDADEKKDIEGEIEDLGGR